LRRVGQRHGTALAQRGFEQVLPRAAHARIVGIVRVQLQPQQRPLRLRRSAHAVPLDRRGAAPAAACAVDEALAVHRAPLGQQHQA